TGPGAAEPERAAGHGGTTQGFYLTDVPGYGYARASHGERAAFQALLRRVVSRPRLAGVLLLLDGRRDPRPEDRAIQAVFAAKGTRVLAAVTKGDKLPLGRRAGRERDLRETLELDAEQLIMTSARSREGIADLRETIAALVRDA